MSSFCSKHKQRNTSAYFELKYSRKHTYKTDQCIVHTIQLNYMYKLVYVMRTLDRLHLSLLNKTGNRDQRASHANTFFNFVYSLKCTGGEVPSRP